jgi:hypothetical protein
MNQTIYLASDTDDEKRIKKANSPLRSAAKKIPEATMRKNSRRAITSFFVVNATS